MLKGFSTRIITSVCPVLFLFALLIPLSESWGYNVITAGCSSSSGSSILRTGTSILRTEGTNGPDIMLGCNTPDIMYGKSASDVLQGRSGNDRLYGDSGDDNLLGGEGGDELHAEDGNDLLEGGDGADYFDCGDGLDVIVDFEPSKGDTDTNNCEDIRERL